MEVVKACYGSNSLSIPKVTLTSGNQMPLLGLGTSKVSLINKTAIR